jgi:predicted dehydrogenase
MLREFRDAIADGREPTMSGSEGLRDLAVVLAAYESARTGETVAVRAP